MSIPDADRLQSGLVCGLAACVGVGPRGQGMTGHGELGVKHQQGIGDGGVDPGRQ